MSGETLLGPALGTERAALVGGRLTLLGGAGADRELGCSEPLEELALVAATRPVRAALVARSARRVYTLEGGALLPLGEPVGRELVALGSLPDAALAIDESGGRHVRALDGAGPAPTLPDLPIRGVAFADAQRGAVVFVGVGLQQTSDGGRTFSPALDLAGAPVHAPDVRLDAEGGHPQLLADWFGLGVARLDAAGRVGPREVARLPAGASPGLRWLAGTRADPIEAAAADGALLSRTVALTARSGWAALVDLERGVVTASVELAPHGRGSCWVTRRARGAVVACRYEDPVAGSRSLAHDVIAEADPPRLERGGELAAVESGGTELPRGGGWIQGPCSGAGVGACVLQPDGRFRSVHAPDVVGALGDGRAIIKERRGGALGLSAVAASGARSELGAVTLGDPPAAVDAIDASSGEVVVLLSRGARAELAVLAAHRVTSPFGVPAGAALGAGRVVAVDGGLLVESSDGGSTWARAPLPAALGAPTSLLVSEVGVVAAGPAARAALLGRGAPSAVPASLSLEHPTALAPPRPTRLLLRCASVGKPERLATLVGGTVLLGPLGAPLGRVAWERSSAEWLDPTAVRPRKAAAKGFAGAPPWTVAGVGRGGLAVFGRWSGVARALVARGGEAEHGDLAPEALPDSAVGPLAVSELGVAWTAGTRLFSRGHGGPATELATTAEPVLVGSPTRDGSPAWIDAPAGAWLRWLRGVQGPLSAAGWVKTSNLAALVALPPCAPPKGSSRVVGQHSLDGLTVELGGARGAASALPIAAVALGGAPCPEEVWVSLHEPRAVGGVPVRWVVLVHGRAVGLTDTPLERVPLRCEPITPQG